MTSQRSLNALEDLFASCNVRFAVLLVLENETKDLAFQHALTACEVTYLKSVAIAPGLEDVVVDLDDFGKYLDDSICCETLTVDGPLSLQVLPYRVTDAGDDGRGVMLYVNANHAICDGRSLMHFLGCASTALPAQLFSKPWQELRPLPDWKEMVAGAKLERWDDDPPYLCSKNQILNIKELCLEHTSKGDECLRFDLSNTSLQSLRQRLKEAEGATLTGLLIAVFMRCLAAEYTGSETRDLAVSVLVDLRGYLSPESDCDQQLPQAHGTVTIIDSIERYLRMMTQRSEPFAKRQLK
eukprot:s1168_g1.t1